MSIDDAVTGPERLGKVGARRDEPNSRMYRTELLAEPGSEWSLLIDGRRVAGVVDEGLDNDGAHAWARRQLGEGTRFLPVANDDSAAAAIEQGRRIDWVASPAGFNERDAAADDLTQRRLDDVARRLAEKVEIEPRETDPGLARLQDARDWSAAAGHFELANSQDHLLDMLRTRSSDETGRAPSPAVPLQRGRDHEREL